MDAAVLSRQPFFNNVTPVISHVVPNHVNGRDCRVICLDFSQELDCAVAVHGHRLNKRRVKILKVEGTVDIDPSPTCGGFDGRV